MGRFRSFLRSCGAAIAACFRGMRTVFRVVYEGGKAVLKPFVEMLPPIAQGLDQAADAVLGLPMAFVKSFLGIKPPLPQAADAAKVAAKTATATKADLTATADLTVAVTDFRRLARLIGRGKCPAPSMYESLSPPLAAYLQRLSQDEARVLGQLSPEILTATLRGERRQEGVRTPAEIATLPPPRVVARNENPAPACEREPGYEGYPKAA